MAKAYAFDLSRVLEGKLEFKEITPAHLMTHLREFNKFVPEQSERVTAIMSLASIYIREEMWYSLADLFTQHSHRADQASNHWPYAAWCKNTLYTSFAEGLIDFLRHPERSRCVNYTGSDVYLSERFISLLKIELYQGDFEYARVEYSAGQTPTNSKHYEIISISDYHIKPADANTDKLGYDEVQLESK